MKKVQRSIDAGRSLCATNRRDLLYSSQNRPSALVVDSGSIFWSNLGTDNGQGEILTAPVAGGGSPTTLAAGQKYPLSIAVDETYVYWVEEGTYPGYTDGALRRCAKTGCNALPELLVSGLLDARGITLDAIAIYFRPGAMARFKSSPSSISVSDKVRVHGFKDWAALG